MSGRVRCDILVDIRGQRSGLSSLLPTHGAWVRVRIGDKHLDLLSHLASYWDPSLLPAFLFSFPLFFLLFFPSSFLPPSSSLKQVALAVPELILY